VVFAAAALLFNRFSVAFMEKLLALEHISKIYKSKTVLNDINLTLKRGKIYGLIGKKGAGKTSLIRLFAGLINPSSGKITKNPEIKPSFIIERAAIFPEKSVFENMAIRCILHNTPFSRIEPMLKTVGITDSNRKPVKNLPQDISQRLGLALAMLSNPDFLVIDGKSDTLFPIIKQFHDDTGAAVLFTCDSLPGNIADEFFFIHEGRLVAQITKAALDKRVRKAVRMSVSNPDAALQILRVKLNIEADVEDGYLVAPLVTSEEKIKQILNENAVRIYNMEHFHNTYEDYFQSIIRGDSNGQ
jgi:ABC-2 type transport system ATP-binding protein